MFNGFFKLTDKELEILGALMQKSPDGNDLCSLKVKKELAKEFHYSSELIVTQHIRNLRMKKAIIKTQSGYKLNKVLLHSPHIQLNIKFDPK